MMAAVVIGFVVRAAFGVLYWQGKPLTHDEREYLALAANLAAGRGFTQDLPNEPEQPGVQKFGRAPIYPLFLAPVVAWNPELRAGRMPADVPASVQIAQAIVGALGVWLIGAIAGRLGGPRMGVAAAWVAAVYPPLAWICAYALTEAFYATLVLAVVWWLAPLLDDDGASNARASRGEGRSLDGNGSGSESNGGARSGNRSSGDWRIAIGGALIGLAILTRPATIFFVPFALLLAWRQRRAWVMWMLAGVLLVVAPWTVRNAIVYQRFVLVASEGGVTFWTGNHREARGEGDLAANPHLKLLNLEFRARHPGLTEEQLEPIYYREALGFMAEAPARWLGLELKKLIYTWVPIGPSYRLHSPLYFWTSALSYGALLPVALVGGWRLWRMRRRPWTLWALAASTCLVALVFFPQERFRLPVVDPALIVCAAAVALPAPGTRRIP